MPVNRFDTSQSVPDEGPAPADQPSGGGPQAIERLARQLEELADDARLYLAARGDALVAVVRRAALWLVVVLVGLVTLVAAIGTAAAMTLQGLGEWVATLLGGRPWAGNLIVGFGFLAISLTGVVAAVSMLLARSRRRTEKRYARRQQGARFERDAAKAAGHSQRS